MKTNKHDITLGQFNETIQKWIDYLDDYTIEMLSQKPASESWSLGQVYTHIIADTTYFISQMTACLSDHTNIEQAMHEDAKVMFKNNEFPDALLNNPSGNLIRQPENREELLQDLLCIKEKVNELYFGTDFIKSTGKTRHPGLLFFNTMEWLQFAEMHMRHHFRQKRRIDDHLFSHRRRR